MVKGFNMKTLNLKTPKTLNPRTHRNARTLQTRAGLVGNLASHSACAAVIGTMRGAGKELVRMLQRDCRSNEMLDIVLGARRAALCALCCAVLSCAALCCAVLRCAMLPRAVGPCVASVLDYEI
jgi:hypothetical protein